MWIIVGLGNPGSKYERNRHNIGFMAIDELVSKYGLNGPKSKYNAEMYDGEINGVKVIALKPQTYMNNSGESVQPAAHFYKIKPENIIVLHDELDLTPGKVRSKKGGGAAGHNGLRSIDSHLGNNYWRIRMGIGHPGAKELVHSYVLNNFMSDDAAWIDALNQSIAKHMPLMLNNDFDQAMSKINQDMAQILKDLNTNKEQ